MNIDWSKAPEDATHYSPGTDDYSSCWVKWVGSELHGWLVRFDTSWSRLVAQEKDHNQISMHVERPKKQESWDGRGLPPVGAQCEAELYHGGVWIEGFVAYYGKAHFIFESNQLTVGVEISGKIRTSAFRPIKTAEQLAGEEKKEAIKQICIDAGCPEMTPGQLRVAEILYDKGYRKQ